MQPALDTRWLSQAACVTMPVDPLRTTTMATRRKADFPTDRIRRYLEPGPVVLVSSAHRGVRHIMTLGWHMMLDFEPALVGCYIWEENRSFASIRASRECVINLPTADMVDTVIGIGNSHGTADSTYRDKFEQFGLSPAAATKVAAPLIAECFANFECRLVDTSQIRRRGLFIFEVVKAHVARTPKYPATLHYRGDGVFMVAGRNVNYRRRFRPENL